MCMDVHVHVLLDVHVHMLLDVHVHVCCVCACVRACGHACVHAYVCVCLLACIAHGGGSMSIVHTWGHELTCENIPIPIGGP